MVRDALRKAERNGNHAALREDLAKILQIAEGLHGNHSRGKVIFACREQGIWREKDIPPRVGQSQIKVDSRFHLRPLVDAYSGLPRTCIALVDRKRARIFELQEGEITQKTGSGVWALARSARAVMASRDMRPDIASATWRTR